MHNLFSTSKTLRFELQPVGRTAENLAKIIEEDEIRAEKFKRVKKYADEAHKAFIEDVLTNINADGISYYFKHCYEAYKEHNAAELETTMNNARKIISEAFTKDKRCGELFGKELITKILKEQYKDSKKALEDIADFDTFTTYFTGYNQNRKNMYVNEAKATAIVHRLIDENLPVFLKNIELFAKASNAMPELKENIAKLGIDTDELFSKPENYVHFLAQSGIERYNLAIGGRFEDGSSKIQGINECINLYNQKNKTKLPKLGILYKQILSDRTAASFVLDSINSDAELIEAVTGIFDAYRDILMRGELENAICNLDKYDLNKIYVNNDTSLTALSKAVYGGWEFVGNLREQLYDKEYAGKAVKGTEKYTEARDKELKKAKQLSLGFIEDCVREFAPEQAGKLAEYFAAKYAECAKEIQKAYAYCKEILNAEYNEKKLLSDDVSIEKIKSLLDAMKTLHDCVKTLIPKDNTLETDAQFYNVLSYDRLAEIIPAYNKARNYVTQKPYSTEKFKLNFDCATLLDGWDLNKESANLGVLLEKDGCYYLAVMNKKNNKVFAEYPAAADGSYKKIEYKLLPGPNKMLPKVFFSTKGREIFNPPEALLSKYERGLHKKGADFDLKFCHELIDYFKSAIAVHPDWKNFGFKFSDTQTYEDTSGFYKEVEHQGYKISFKDIAPEYIDKLVEEGKIYLFKIYNKDFSQYSKGKPNLHTLYWKALFDADNLKDVVYKLNGEAEVFYRKKSLEAKITHPKNQPVANKNLNNDKKASVFEYDLIKDRRYTVDKFLFHVPLTMNFKASGSVKLNSLVNEAVCREKEQYVIGIDRGERNLLYVSVVNSKGEIVEQYSLNGIINEHQGKTFENDYHELLAKREEERDKARKSWKTIANIKELKEGYMSQVVNKLVKLMLKYNAVIVLEDLNGGFTNSRKKVEKSVYTKFETALVSKLAYLVNKDADKFAEGGVLNAYQLASADLGSSFQNGVIFYIPAWNTSKIDPTTGFVNLFNLRDVTSETTGKEFVSKFTDIRFNGEYYEFDIDYANFTDKACGKKKNWTLCSYGERIRSFRNPAKNSEWDSQEINLTAEFKKLFDRYGIGEKNIKAEILAKADSKFFKANGSEGYLGFVTLFRLMVQLRNSVTNSNVDYILSPVKNAKGEFYDSRKYTEKSQLPCDADANGAYNIARKGLMLIDRIREANGEKVNYIIKNNEWLDYVQSKDK